MAKVDTGLSSEPLDVSGVIASVSDPSCGAVASFVGTVRETAAVPENEGKRVTGLTYEAHRDAADNRLRAICEEAAQRWGLERVAAVHRTGHCSLGDPTVVVACGAPHRREALAACAWLIDTLKATVPIFKKEIYTDGSSWVGEDA